MSWPISLLAESYLLIRSDMSRSEFPKRPVFSNRLELRPLKIKISEILPIEPLMFAQCPRSKSTRSPQALIGVNTNPCASNPISSTIRKEKAMGINSAPKTIPQLG